MEPNHRGRRDGVGQVLLRALLAVVAVVGTLVCSASLAPAAHATTPYSPLTWGAPTPVDHQAPYDNGLGITATSCPSASLCVAVDDFGNVLASTDPAGGAGTWHKWAVEPRGAFVGLSCPSVSLCVAVDDEGGVVTSTDPAGGIATWHTTKLPNGGGAFTVACPTATFCVANVGAGVETSTDPAGGAGAWDSTGALVGANGLSCPSVSFCVGSNGSDDIETTTNPSGGPDAWTTGTVTGVTGIRGLSCPSVRLCVAVGDSGQVVTSSDPGEGPSTWSVEGVDRSTTIRGISCPSVTLCVANDSDGNVLSSINPTGGATAWSVVNVADGPNQSLGSVYCLVQTFCVATDNLGNLYLSTDPTGGPSAWSVTNIDGVDSFTSVTCPSASFCLATDSDGNVVTSTDPTGGSGAWSVANVDGNNSIIDASCPSISFCVAVDAVGNVLVSSDPTGGLGAWSVTRLESGVSLEGVSCPSVDLCVVTDAAGNVVTSTDPTDGGNAWNELNVDGTTALAGISCPSVTLCVIGSSGGQILTSTDPGGGPGEWKTSQLSGTQFRKLDCPTTLFCVASANGGVVSSTDPTGGSGSWISTGLTGVGTSIYQATGLSCPSTTICVAASDFGYVGYSTDPTGGGGAWPATLIDSVWVTDVSCPSTTLCVAVDYVGDVVVGSATPPVVASVSPSIGTTAGGASVTITGSGFNSATAVDFGSTAATIVGLCTDTICNVTAPAESVGPVAVTVTTPIGTSSATLTSANTYTYVTPAAPQPYHPLAPVRICDTRPSQTKAACPGATTVGPNGIVTVTAEGHGGIPASGVTAVVVNVTATDTTAQSHLTVFPGGETEPTASNLNWMAGQTVPNLVTVGLSAAGTFEAENLNGNADVILDVEGYYGPGSAGAGLYNALSTPGRICDTRAGNPSGLSGTALTQCEGRAPASGSALAVTIDGLGGVPTQGVGAVVLNVTAVGAAASGFLTVYPARSTAPLASNVNYTAGAVISNRVIVPVSADGEIDIQSSKGNPDIVVDVAGWYTDSSNSSATGAQYIPAVTPTRVCDTRSGLAYSTPCADDTLGAGTTLPVTVAGTDGIPSGVAAVVLNVTATNTTATSHLTVSPAGLSIPTVSDLNWRTGRTVPNLVIATVGTRGQIDLTNFAGSTDVIVDVVGWFS